MTVLALPVLVVAPVMLLLAALLALGSYGPWGWAADVVLLVALGWGGREAVRRTRRWWASTEAPAQPLRQDGPRRSDDEG